METEIWVAIIGGSAVILAAGLGLVGVLVSHKRKKKSAEQQTLYPPSEIHPDQPGLSHRMGLIHAEHLEYHESLVHLKQAIDGYDLTSFERAQALVDAGIKHNELAEYSDAIDCFKQAEAIFMEDPNKNQVQITTVHNNIAVVYDEQGKYDEALRWHKKALAIREKVLAKEHPYTATTYNNIAIVYGGQGAHKKALEWFFRSLAITEKVLGKEHPDTAGTYNNIANVYRNEGNYDEALEWYGKALVAKEKAWGKEHPDTAGTYNNIATVRHNQGKYDQSLELYLKAYKIVCKVFDPEHPSSKMYLSNMKIAYKAAKRKWPFAWWLKRQMKKKLK